MLAPQHRLSAVHYLSKRFLPITSKADLVTAVGPDHTMLIRAFSAALVDDAVLVQRGLLEVLVVCLPLDRGVFEETAVCVLMRAVLGVVLRKDMSLNRRLYSWLLGREGGQQTQ